MNEPRTAPPLSAFALDVNNARDLASDVVGEAGRLNVMPAAYYEGTTRTERALVALKHGAYCLPTTELIDWLREYINGRSAIEIGAGNGVIADALGITATDNKMQDDPMVRALYAAARQPPVMYGENVERLEARLAVRKYRPKVVVASWVTHKFDPRNEAAGGNMFGVDESDILAHCDEYVFIGNTHVHSAKPLWNRSPHLIENPSWLYSRAFNGSPDFIAVWRRKRVNT